MFFKENKKIIIQAIFGLLFIGLAYFFIRYQRAELIKVRVILSNAEIFWVLTGLLISVFFIFLQGFMYEKSFKTVNETVPYYTALKVFLKRNFIGVFIPAGGVASLGFFTRDFERKQIPLTKTYFASSIYVVTGSFSLVILALPVLFWSLISKNLFFNQIYSFFALCILVGLVVFIVYSLVRQGFVYHLIIRVSPVLEKYLMEIRSLKIRKTSYALTLASSTLVEFIGIIHLMIAMKALGFPVSVEAAIMGYITSMLFQVISPFMRGLGAIELSITFILTRYGFNTVDAISVTLLYRLFGFWFPLIISGLSFAFARNSILLRIVPAILSFLLGIINIIAVLSPPIPARLVILQDFLPQFVFDISGYVLMMTGLVLLVNSAFLLKGLRTALFVSLVLALLSLIAHVFSALNYQEALLAVLLIVSLYYSRRHYFVKNNPRFGQVSISTALISVLAVISYGIIGFYFLEEKYFNINFSFPESVKHTLQNFFFLRDENLNPTSDFARDFLTTIKIAGFLSLAFLFYTLIKPLIYQFTRRDDERKTAQDLVLKYSNSSLDYYKTNTDKYLFFDHTNESFLAYRVAGNYAIVLENPVSVGEEEMRKCIYAFDKYCSDNGLKCFYYLVPEKSLQVYTESKKKYFLIGQEAKIELEHFSTEILSEDIQRSLQLVNNNGFKSKVYEAPLEEKIIHQLKSVSDNWRENPDHKDAIFLHSVFNKSEIRYQTIITVENRVGRICAFLNVIPEYRTGECTFDLFRKTGETPDEILDFLILEYIKYLKSKSYKYANLGFAPLSKTGGQAELHQMSLKFAYEKLSTFPQYKGWRELREKFSPQWHNLYVIYDHHYDLYDLPSVLRKVMMPGKNI